MKVDGRKIDHARLEEIRFAAVKAVQEGKTPSRTARDLGIEGAASIPCFVAETSYAAS